ncbi:CPBP family intramembrane metalloprotease [Blautia producta]|nr:CPBP family intramembrane metalloprotease [Blautia producta]NSG17068.1 CPBP family intramembrane metalloprotease [Blautia producta]NSJ77267.1 CPBP family intramembrane metalloprotease [Blautia producta]
MGLMWVPAFAAICTKLIYDRTIKGIGWKIRGWKQMSFAYILPLLSCILVYGYTWLTELGGCAPMEIEQILIMAILGLFLSMITAIGEEIGWRGFLLTELRATLSYKKINFAIGIIWYLYHMPLIIFSNYNNGNKFSSALCFFVMVMAMTTIANTLCMEANSMWPSIVLHSSHNLFVQSIFDKMTINASYT